MEYVGVHKNVTPAGYPSAGNISYVEMWLCRCKCGREKQVSRSNLLAGNSKQCLSCARAGCKKSAEHKAEMQVKAAIRQRWYAYVRGDCIPEWEDFNTFYEWAKTKEHTKYIRKHSCSDPHSPNNTFYSDEIESSALARERTIAILVSKGATKEAAIARVDNMSRQRRTQILWAAEGRCQTCGDPRGETASTTLCMKCHIKVRNSERRKKGWTEEEIAAKPVVIKQPREPKEKRVRKPPGTCRKCMEPAVKQDLCDGHYAEHIEECRIRHRMKKFGWTREQVLAWPKGRHVK